ncbi:Uncharacterised protein [Mycobacteroides abscessus]|uniref:hypothetical protein n=1 Tax=Mycobacteriaceae TaxID=1762 RepID=UPI000301D45F|nr:hypothetical protein [Mycobacteroides abscessus]CPT79090.1 Uncharacterised protein [Mycobacteroides abscessus]CPU62768.1 Uncharacterised protein [Mycobacteroides abscessus]SKQ36644.1 Uncharacterised protein [Mycobacteroides abscessus subsp. massiliense]SKW96819.1 Uncharacterised protein [Mycobacteroides abscessus subsp. massiliense]
MALTHPVDPTDINLALQIGIGPQLEWQLDASELERRLDAAAYAAAAILNAAFYEADLSAAERAEAERAYAQAPYAIKESAR